MIQDNHAYKDRFSFQAAEYRRFRPTYPLELFDYLSSLTEEHTAAWDCATGNGQSAVALASHYSKIIATDASSSQIQQAIRHKNVDYHTAPAHNNDVDDSSIDLVTVAQAVHWFSHRQFYSEVSRVLKPHGVIAVWAYHLPLVNPETDKLVEYLYATVLRPFWEDEIRHIETGYRDLPFPFIKLQTPQFSMKANWNLREFTGYIETWSATAAYRQKNGRSPVEEMMQPLHKAWENPESKKTLSWPLILMAGRLKEENMSSSSRKN